MKNTEHNTAQWTAAEECYNRPFHPNDAKTLAKGKPSDRLLGFSLSHFVFRTHPPARQPVCLCIARTADQCYDSGLSPFRTMDWKRDWLDAPLIFERFV
ncbi:hypothetical protein DdX_09957 [Ditylenchus destructor]|uniref:Uncharacterized protein n=1 Tax=Ditylenchus destructor TaxID=166010 RepID=A0AAD4R604_9BILA|nr:hypothetical protein DdX_09957 [Ditylenchus destructor]